MEDESANVLPVVLASLRRILSCMGCGKRLVHPYRGTCFHAFCKECFEGVNLSVNKCMVCSAPCSASIDSEVLLLGDMVKAFDRFDNFLSSSVLRANTAEAAATFVEEAVVDSTIRPVHDMNVSETLFIGSSLGVEVSDVSKIASNASPSGLPSALGEATPKRQRFCDQETFFSYSPPPSSSQLDPHDISANKFQQQPPRKSYSEPIQISNGGNSFAYSNSRNCSLQIHLGSFSCSELDISTQQYLNESQFVTQNSTLGRMVTDIDAIKKNIEEMLDNAAKNHLSHSEESSRVGIEADTVANEDSSLLISQELVPLSPGNRDWSHDGRIPHAKVDQSQSLNETQHSLVRPDIDETIPFDFGSVSRSPDKVVYDKFPNKSQAFFVTAVCNEEEQLDLMKTAISKGWIFDDLSRDDLAYAGIRPINVLVCPIAKNSEGINLTYRTMPYMKALLLGYLIVDFSWLVDSIRDDALRSPYPYELAGTVLDKSPRIPIRARFLQRTQLGGIHLLDDYSFTIVDEGNIQRYTKGRWVRDDVESLIKLAGGKLANSDTSCDHRFGSLPSRYIRLSLRLRGKENISATIVTSGMAISVSWLFESICNLRIPIDLSEFLMPTFNADTYK